MVLTGGSSRPLTCRYDVPQFGDPWFDCVASNSALGKQKATHACLTPDGTRRAPFLAPATLCARIEDNVFQTCGPGSSVVGGRSKSRSHSGLTAASASRSTMPRDAISASSSRNPS